MSTPASPPIPSRHPAAEEIKFTLPPPEPTGVASLVVHPLARAGRQFMKSLWRPSTIVYPFKTPFGKTEERLENPEFRKEVDIRSGVPLGVGEVWDNYRGVHALNVQTCISCNLCMFSCPDTCIEMVTTETPDGKTKKCPQIDYGKCSFCGFCSDACPEGCLSMTSRYTLTTNDRGHMVYSPKMMYAIYRTKLPMNPIRLARPENEDNILLDEDLCIGCNACARDCPTKCITMIDIPKPSAPKPGEKLPKRIWKEPMVNDEDCVRCGTCISVCPKECLYWGSHG
ncbi:MAG: 4Fe-4S binding protein [Euryarchaeota archaeon]|nr:4Fe-4S binding protein [Euryarchaeota archaeon]MDE1835210.1 4Fe-4S binding protein [Euryarchaeota archaeon]MDE1880067.1 4Fe-4S binding protein [Euryarchaeota archaeon]MDE2043506.1 4Fe-4S binding protein [Thermoplasmata archaeon]